MNRGAIVAKAIVGTERGAQARFAEKHGIDQGYLSAILSAARTPGLKLRRLFRELGVEMFLWDEPAEEAKSTGGEAA